MTHDWMIRGVGRDAVVPSRRWKTVRDVLEPAEGV